MQKSLIRIFVGSFSSLVLLACAAGAVANLWPDSVNSISLLSAFEWDAPTRTLARNNVLESAAGLKSSMPVFSSDGEVVILDDWNYTAIKQAQPLPSKVR
jgi:hypothetical protein